MNPVRKDTAKKIQCHRLTGGFTLLELLVVISIIAILSGLIIPNLVHSKKRANINKTKIELGQIAGAMQRYYMVFCDYPPTSLKKLNKHVSPNPINQGIESLVACLSTTSKGGPFLGQWKENRYTNLDKDKARTNLTNWWFGDKQLRELVDPWQNPFVYFHSRDYEIASQYSKYFNKYRKKFIALPQKSSKTNTWHNPLAFQLWSLGPNEKNNNGAEDDIPNW